MSALVRRLGRTEDGFTLVELLVVIVILGILIAIAVPTFLGQTNKAKDASAQTSLSTAYANAEADKVDNDGKFEDAATIASDLTADEPELGTVQTATDTSTITTAGVLYIISGTGAPGSLTPGADGQEFEAAIKSQSGAICTVTVTEDAAPQFQCTGD